VITIFIKPYALRSERMLPADLPKDEIERLKTLLKYDILDTEVEKVFDDLTELASEICETPIALISLVDSERQWFKSRVGLDAEETPRDIAFCSHAILQKSVFEVTDTHEDHRFIDNPLVLDDPSIRFYAGAPLLSPSGHAIGTLCVISDKPKKLNSHQRKTLEILGREVISQLELRLQLSQLEKANERKTEYLSSLSHELRTPLHAIISISQLMLNNPQVKLPEDYLGYINHINFSGKRLLNLVDTILDISKIEEGTLELVDKVINVEDYFNSIEDLIISLARKKSLEISFSVNAGTIKSIKIDDSRLSQIILSLVSNSIKFSAENQAIFITVVVTSNELVFAIKDHGKGITAEDLPFVFEKFQRLSNKNTTEGSGLGLMITKSLVETMGGKIKLLSEPNKGTLAKVTLPLNPIDHDASSDESTLVKGFDKSISVLVVEDNEINQQVAIAIFNSIGLKIDLAEDGQQAVDKATGSSYDIILMDIHLPDFDGYEASRKIIAAIPNQVIVAFTADVFVNQDSRLIESGIVDAINKPFDMADLLNVLNRYCPA
jgi:signal transduction histidine kinase